MDIEMQPALKAAIAQYIAEVIERRHGEASVDVNLALSLSIMFRSEAHAQMTAARREMGAAIAQVEIERAVAMESKNGEQESPVK